MVEIKAAMKRLRYNQKTLAEDVGCSQVTVTNWFTGKTKPSIYSIKNIAKVLEMDFNDVYNTFKGVK